MISDRQKGNAKGRTTQLWRQGCVLHFAFDEQLPKGESRWNIELKEVYLIAILEFNLRNNTSDGYTHNISLVNRDTGKIFYNKLDYRLLELPKFVKTEAGLKTDLDRCPYLLKHMGHLDKVPVVLNKRGFQKLFKIAEVSNLTKEGKAIYDSNLKAKWDYENSIAFAREEAKEKGIERGRYEEAVDITREFKKEGSSIGFIAKITKLPVSEIEKLY